MKWAILLTLSIFLAGCTASVDEGSDGPTPSDPASSDEVTFGYAVNPPAAPVQDNVWTATGTVDQPTMVAALQGPVHDFVGEQVQVNGSWSIDVALESGGQEVWIELDEVDGDGYAFVVIEVNVLAPSTVTIDYGSTVDRDRVEDTVWVDIVAYDSRSMYEAEGATHPEYANVHDVMVAWEEQYGHQITYSYNDGFGSFAIDRIDGEGNALSAGEPPWWCYDLNGEHADQGISIKRFQPGDVIAWDLGTCDGAVM